MTKPTPPILKRGRLIPALLFALTLSPGCNLVNFGEDPPPASCPRADEAASPEEAALECSDTHPHPS
ncbi:MAG: hypothetical protein P8Q97_18185 [Myxococcota bacterium]|jgi:hypothetical protein|nr:hypothetical protein [Myxococcota bacterium]